MTVSVETDLCLHAGRPQGKLYPQYARPAPGGLETHLRIRPKERQEDWEQHQSIEDAQDC